MRSFLFVRLDRGIDILIFWLSKLSSLTYSVVAVIKCNGTSYTIQVVVLILLRKDVSIFELYQRPADFFSLNHVTGVVTRIYQTWYEGDSKTHLFNPC